jgi:anaerobic magnesium-protoporphyrin IX monomethyl ester cyclase
MLKRVDLDHIAKTVRTVLKSGIILKVNLVIGFPDERHRDVLQSLLYGMKLAFFGAHSVLFYRFTPYPGSEYFNQLQQEGMLPAPGPQFDRFLVTNIYNELREMKSYSRHISDRWIRIYMFGGYALAQAVYYGVRPWEILRMIGRVWRRDPLTQSELLIIGLLEKLKLRRPASAPASPAPITREKLVRTDSAA